MLRILLLIDSNPQFSHQRDLERAYPFGCIDYTVKLQPCLTTKLT